ncbi:hypothetical protein TSH64_31485 [Azospirillum sp. TSH64]|nr:hypothetical protein TSH64_31485 [Azospirillum sp. TSH64]
MPWPAKAASPWISTPITCSRSRSRRCCCLARTLPSTTGLTHSRWDGLAVSDRWTMLPLKSRSDEVPRWYFTSPEPWTSSGLDGLPWNSEKTAEKGLPMKLVSMFRRPRWAMPTTASFRPSWPPRFRICSSAGIIDSPPSRPKRLVPVYFSCRNFSKPSAAVSRSRMARLPFTVKSVWLRPPSMRSWIQAFSSGSWMCMNSTPIVPQ